MTKLLPITERKKLRPLIKNCRQTYLLNLLTHYISLFWIEVFLHYRVVSFTLVFHCKAKREIVSFVLQ